MGRVIQLKDGSILTCYESRNFLSDIIYDYLGVDAYNLYEQFITDLNDSKDILYGDYLTLLAEYDDMEDRYEDIKYKYNCLKSRTTLKDENIWGL